MNTGHYLTFFIVLLLLSSCLHYAAAPEFDRAERLMEEHPDSALALLNTMIISNDAESQARYALLLSQARDKNYIDVTDDSLILLAVNYYEKRNDLYRLMLSYFYHARVLYNKESFARSLLVHHKSLRCAESLGDYFWCGRNADQIFAIYEKFYYDKDALHYAKLTFDYYNKLDRQTPFKSYAVLGLARAYYNSEMYEEALPFAKSAVDSAKKYNNEIIYRAAKKISSDCYYYLDIQDEAIKGYNELLTYDDNPDLLGCIGLSYLRSGNKTKAYAISVDSINPLSPILLSFKSSIYKSKGDFKMALLLTEDLMVRNDSALVNSLSQGFGAELSDYYDYETRIKDLELKNVKMFNWIVIIIAVLIVAMVLMLIVWMHRRHNQNIEKNLNIAHNLREILALREAQYLNAQNEILKLLSSRFIMFDSLFASYYECKVAKGLRKKISEEVEKLIFDLMTEERLSEFEDLLNKNGHGIVALLKKDLPDLKDADYRLFIYSALGFSNIAIALFLDEDKIDAVYNRKARLKTKIKKSDSVNKGLFLRNL